MPHSVHILCIDDPKYIFINNSTIASISFQALCLTSDGLHCRPFINSTTGEPKSTNEGQGRTSLDLTNVSLLSLLCPRHLAALQQLFIINLLRLPSKGPRRTPRRTNPVVTWRRRRGRKSKATMRRRNRGPLPRPPDTVPVFDRNGHIIRQKERVSAEKACRN